MFSPPRPPAPPGRRPRRALSPSPSTASSAPAGRPGLLNTHTPASHKASFPSPAVQSIPVWPLRYGFEWSSDEVTVLSRVFPKSEGTPPPGGRRGLAASAARGIRCSWHPTRRSSHTSSSSGVVSHDSVPFPPPRRLPFLGRGVSLRFATEFQLPSDSGRSGAPGRPTPEAAQDQVFGVIAPLVQNTPLPGAAPANVPPPPGLVVGGEGWTRR